MRDDSTLAYRLGMLNNHYDYLTRQWDGDVDLYDSFHDIHVHENPHLREMASSRGKIDALEYIRDDELPPGSDEYDWLNTDRNDALLRNVTEAAVDAITDRGGAGSTWTDYLRGWVYSLRFALDSQERPWTSRCYREPGDAAEFLE